MAERALVESFGDCHKIRMTELRIRKIGNSVGVILPDELLAHLNVEVGQSVSVTRTPHGIALRACGAAVSPQMEVARAVMTRRKRALRTLAK